MRVVRLRFVSVLLVAAVGAGCGGGDDTKGSATPKASAVKTKDRASIVGPAGKKIAAVTTALLDAKDGGAPCFAITASDYVEELGGPEACAAALGPIATGPLDTIVSAKAVGGGETGSAEVESSDGSVRQTILFARTFDGEYTIDGLGPAKK